MKRRSLLLGILYSVFLNTPWALPNTEGIQVYQKNLLSYPDRKQSLAEDISRFRYADDLWETLRQEFTLAHYEEMPSVQTQIAWFLNHQEFLFNTTTRAAPYLYFILQQARKRHLPVELVLLPMIESAYNPFAYSTAGAAGIWQMMPGTASGYGIQQNGWYDGRRDVVRSTQAALNHLSYLGNFFEGNWLLAIAAYDTGEGNVLSAINRNLREGRSIEFWNLPLAQETRDYVPRLLALAAIIANPEKYPVYFPPVHNAPYLAQIDMGEPIDLKKAANLAGLSFKKLLRLNPAYNTTIEANGPSQLILPLENVIQFTRNLTTVTPEKENVIVAENAEDIFLPVPAAPPKQTTKALVSRFEKINGGHYIVQPGDTVYMARDGDSLNTIAQHFHTPKKLVAMINQCNDENITPGTSLIIPTHLTHTQFADAGSHRNYDLFPGDKIYVVKHGDTIAKIAKKFHTTAPSIRLANLMTDAELRDGENLVIPAHV